MELASSLRWIIWSWCGRGLERQISSSNRTSAAWCCPGPVPWAHRQPSGSGCGSRQDGSWGELAHPDQGEGCTRLPGIGLILPTVYSWFLDSSRAHAQPNTSASRFGVGRHLCGVLQTLKAALVSAPVLAYPTREGHFVLSTDASNGNCFIVMAAVGCPKL